MKAKLLLIFIFSVTILVAQEKQITKLLNHQLKKEILKFPDEGDSLKLIKSFTIDENKVLSFEFSKFNVDNEGREFTKQEIHLDKIKGFIKDINVIFEASEEDAVKITTVIFDEKGQEVSRENYTYHLFFTQISREKENEYFRNKILKAFSKGGYNLSSEFWAD